MLTIKRRFPTREVYLTTGAIGAICAAGFVAALVSAHPLTNEAAVVTSVEASDEKDEVPIDSQTDQKPSTTPAADRTPNVSLHPTRSITVNPTPRAASPSPSSTATPAPAPSESPSPTPTPSDSPEPTPNPGSEDPLVSVE